MKKLDDIKEEYEAFETKLDSIKTVDDLVTYIDVALLDIDENIKNINKNFNNNKKDKLYAKVKNFFFFSSYDTIYYDKDNKLLRELVLINLIYVNFFSTIATIVDDNNCKELVKLTDFLAIHYNKDLDFVEGKRSNLEYESKGYGCINYRDEDSFPAVYDFFNNKISELSNLNNIEKVKKI